MGLATGIATGAVIGAVIGGIAPLLMAIVAKGRNRPWDLTTLRSDDDVTAKVDAWAQANGYRLVVGEGRSRIYRKGRNVLTSPMFLEVARDGSDYAFKSYVEINGWVQKATLALSGDDVLVKVPRALARKVHNQLFASLGHPGLP